MQSSLSRIFMGGGDAMRVCHIRRSVGRVGVEGNTSTSIGPLVKWKDELRGNWSMGTVPKVAVLYDDGTVILSQLLTNMAEQSSVRLMLSTT